MEARFFIAGRVRGPAGHRVDQSKSLPEPQSISGQFGRAGIKSYFPVMIVDSTICIEPGSLSEYAWCAQAMASTEPWITLGRDGAACEAALRRPGSELFIARRGNERLGFILLTANGLAGSPYVAAIAVDQGTRGHGVGTQLLAFAERRYPEARNIFLCVSDFNPRARMLYERRGYEPAGVLEDYVVEGHAELLMRKRLR